MSRSRLSLLDWPAWASLAGALVLAGCGLIPDGGDAIANDLRAKRLPTIEAIEYQRYDGLHGPRLEVYLVPGATWTDAKIIACQILPPIIEAHEPPENFIFEINDSNGDLLTHDGNRSP